MILRNEILPGQKLHHQELSERLGVSRTPVREALTRLVQEGYVALLPNRGFTCKEIRLQEANELYQLREALEAATVEKAIENLTETALTALPERRAISMIVNQRSRGEPTASMIPLVAPPRIRST